MALTEKTFHQIEITMNDSVQVRATRIIYDNGAEISQAHHRTVISPGDDFSSQPTRVKRICQRIHTPFSVRQFDAVNELRDKQRVADQAQARVDSAQADFGNDPSPANAAALASATSARDTAESNRNDAATVRDSAVAAYDADIG